MNKKDLIKAILNLNGKEARNMSESNIIPIRKSLWTRIKNFFRTERDLADQYLNLFNPDKPVASSEGQLLKLQPRDISRDTVIFMVPSYDGELIKLDYNGDIYVKGKLIENDKELVAGLREFLAGTRR